MADFDVVGESMNELKELMDALLMLDDLKELIRSSNDCIKEFRELLCFDDRESRNLVNLI